MSTVRDLIVLPDSLRTVLEIRNRKDLVCPSSVESSLSNISFFRSSVPSANARPSASMDFRQGQAQVHVHQGRGSGGRFRNPTTNNTRFTHLASVSAPEGWRHSGPQNHNQHNNQHQHNQHNHDDGWVPVSTSRKQGGGYHHRHHHGAGAGSGSTNTVVAPPSENAWKTTRYQSVETKIVSESIEDRIMGKVRSKINKLGDSTYESTKAFMQQILDSGETDFLDEFMQFVFQKAATECFCGMYARLLHELADQFGHLRIEMQKRFRDYTQIFVEAEKTPDVGTADYMAFVARQEQKKFRRGYSQFVAELAKLGEVEETDFRSLVEKIVASIQGVQTSPEQKTICEEYVDCLSKMCMAGASLLVKAGWMKDCLEQLHTIANAPRIESPGLTNKARFAIMDLLDFATRGWK